MFWMLLKVLWGLYYGVKGAIVISALALWTTAVLLINGNFALSDLEWIVEGGQMFVALCSDHYVLEWTGATSASGAALALLRFGAMALFTYACNYVSTKWTEIRTGLIADVARSVVAQRGND